MPNVAVERVRDGTEKNLPVFAEIAKRLEDIRRRAFELFEKRGAQLGHAFEDWVKAEHQVLGWSAAEMAERDGEYAIQMTLPAFDAKDVQVTATSSEVIVHAETKSQKTTERGNVLWTEFGSSDVYRRFEMPQPIDPDTVKAYLEDGVLRITAGKAMAGTKEKTIAATG